MHDETRRGTDHLLSFKNSKTYFKLECRENSLKFKFKIILECIHTYQVCDIKHNYFTFNSVICLLMDNNNIIISKGFVYIICLYLSGQLLATET